MTDIVDDLRVRRDAWAARFLIVIFVGFAAAIVAWEVPGEGWVTYARMAATWIFVASLPCAFGTWLCFAAAHWRLRQARTS